MERHAFFNTVCRTEGLNKDRALLLALYSDGMSYTPEFLQKMAAEIKTLNAAETKHIISVLQER